MQYSVKSSLLCKVAPINAIKSDSFPTLILLHGRGADENDLLSLAPYLDPRLLVLSVRAPFAFPMGGYTWYEILQVGKPEEGQFKESYELLRNFLGDIKKQLPVNPNQVYLLGFSMGSMMSYALALTKPTEIKGVVAHSGYIPEETELHYSWNNLRNSSFLVAHGTFDPVIPVQLGRRAKELLSKTEASLTYKEYPIGHNISEESLHDLAAWLQQQLQT